MHTIKTFTLCFLRARNCGQQRTNLIEDKKEGKKEMCSSFIIISDLILVPPSILSLSLCCVCLLMIARSHSTEKLLNSMFDSSSSWHSYHLCNPSILVPDKNGASLMPFEFFMRWWQCLCLRWKTAGLSQASNLQMLIQFLTNCSSGLIP